MSPNATGRAEPAMEALAREVGTALADGRVPERALETLGTEDPARLSAALIAAAADPDLGPVRGVWLAPLLASATPERGAEHLCELANRHRAGLGAALPSEVLASLARVVANSEFLARTLRRHPNWIASLGGVDAPSFEPQRPAADWTAIRIAKYQALLLIAARDLAGRNFDQSLRELSDLADVCLDAALERAEVESEAPAPALLALGKLGGRELNFSSDVDLMFVYEPGAEPEDAAHISTLTRLIRTLKSNLEAPSEDGFGYRVDLDLRPEGKVGALANSVESALSYYESYGADWERQMLIRLRPLAGDLRAGERFAEAVRPFVYRRSIDTGAIRAVRDMKTRIERERQEAGRDLEVDLKEGPGGIRDVEFFAQALQLFSGAQDPALRTGNALDALAELGRAGYVPEAVTDQLCDAYRWLRRAEHAVQMVEERQVRDFPRKPAAQLALARRMGYAEVSGSDARNRLLDDWTRARAEVRGHFDALVLEGDGGSDA